MEKVLQDPSLVQYILEKLFSNASIFLQEPASTVYYHLHYRKGWRLLADCPRLLTLQLINKTFYSTMKSTQFHVKVIAMSRPMLGHDPYVPVDLSTPFKWLKDHFIPQQVYVPSIGNGFDLGTDTMACGVKENMLDAEYVNIERLEGLLGVFHHQKVMTGTKRLRIGGVGHTGMVSRLAVERMFHESQISAMYTTNDLMVNMGSVEDLIIDSPLPVRVERNHMDGRIEFYMNSCPKNENTEAKIAFRSLNIIVKRFIRDPEKGLGGVYSGVHVACGPGGGPGLLKTYKFHRDLGNIYLGNLDFSGVKRLKIRAYECLGPPVAYGSRMRSREPPQVVRGQALMHRDPGVHRCILEDLDLLMSNHVGDISLGQYYPGYKMLMNMVSRSKDLEEVIYTGVRNDVMDNNHIVEALRKPWVQLSLMKHHDDTPRKPFKVFVQTMWYRSLPGGHGKVAVGVAPVPNILIFDSNPHA